MLIEEVGYSIFVAVLIYVHENTRRAEIVSSEIVSKLNVETRGLWKILRNILREFWQVKQEIELKWNLGCDNYLEKYLYYCFV